MCVPGCQDAVRHALTRRGFFRGAAATSFAAVSIDPAGAAPRKFKSVVDLTHALSAEFPTFDGEPGIELQKRYEFTKDGYNLNWWHISEHAGTHLDAPIHFSTSGNTVERIAADTLVAPLVVIDVVDKAAANFDYQVMRSDLMAWERRYGRLPEGCCVAMNSGWARYVTDSAKFIGKDAAGVMHFPGFAGEATEWLMTQRKVVGIAVDTLSLDHGPSKDFKTHLLWLPSGRWGLENVANLDKVPANGATLVVGLAKVTGATGGPARLIALV